MGSITSEPEVSSDEFWWQGSLMRIKARAADTDGALGLVEGTFYQGFGPPLHVHHREPSGDVRRAVPGRGHAVGRGVPRRQPQRVHGRLDAWRGLAPAG